MFFLANICKKKFRTLRERYTRELRRSYLEPNTTVKFELFKQLSFLNPFIKFRSIMFETSTDTGKTVVTKREDVSMDKSDTEIKVIEADGYYEEENEHEQPQEHYVQEAAGTTSIIYETASGEQIADYTTTAAQSSNPNSDHHQQHLDDEIPTAINTNNSSSKKRKIESWDDFDEDDNGDKFFSMSIACSLKRLSTINNLKAKVEIFQILEKYACKEKL